MPLVEADEPWPFQWEWSGSLREAGAAAPPPVLAAAPLFASMRRVSVFAGMSSDMANGPDTAVEVPVPDPLGSGACARGPAFEAFLREQHRALVQFLRRRTASEQDAEDAAQESMARLLRYTGTEPTSSWKPLLYRIATNVAHDQRRLAANRCGDKHVPLDDQELATESPTPEEQASRDQQIARLSRAILELPAKCQRVYLLKRVHGLSRAQIARRCGISVKMVEKHLATALVQLRRKVGAGAPGTF